MTRFIRGRQRFWKRITCLRCTFGVSRACSLVESFSLNQSLEEGVSPLSIYGADRASGTRVLPCQINRQTPKRNRHCLLAASDFVKRLNDARYLWSLYICPIIFHKAFLLIWSKSSGKSMKLEFRVLFCLFDYLKIPHLP